MPPTANLLRCALALALLVGCDAELSPGDAGGAAELDAGGNLPDEDASSVADASQQSDAGTDAGEDGVAGGDGGAQADAAVEDDAAAPGSQDSGAEDAGAELQDSGVDDPGSKPEAGESGEVMPVIVASGANHQLALSIDEGVTWCLSNQDGSMSGNDNPHLLRSVTYANGYFVSGSWAKLYRSRNGYEWEDMLAKTGASSPAFGQWIAQIEYGNGWWVATGGYGTAMRSTDLVTWEVTTAGLPGNEASRSLAFGNGVFVTGRDGNAWWQSSDGMTWTGRAGGSTLLVFNGTDFVDRPGFDCRRGGQTCMKAYGGALSRSTDGGGSFSAAGNLPQSVERFAFGQAPAQDFAPGADIPEAVRTCLGL